MPGWPEKWPFLQKPHSLCARSLLRLLTESRLLLGLHKKVKIQLICFVHSLRTFSAFFSIVMFPLKAGRTLTRGCRRGWTPGVALCDVTRISDSPHAFSLASQDVVAPGAVPCSRTHVPVVPQRCDRVPAACHTPSRLGAGLCQGMSVQERCFKTPGPCRPVGRGPGQARYTKRQSSAGKGKGPCFSVAQPLGSALNEGCVRVTLLACVPSSWAACSFPPRQPLYLLCANAGGREPFLM